MKIYKDWFLIIIMNNTAKALASIIAAAALWALSGVAAQALFQIYNFPPFGLVTIRMLAAGSILYLWLRPKWPKRDILPMLLFAAIGMMAAQLFYFLAIDKANVTTGTLLEFLSVPMIFVYEVFKGHYDFTKLRGGALLLSMIGLILLVVGTITNVKLIITPLAFAFGIAAALTAAYQTISAKSLVAKYNTWSVTTWGLLIGGLISVPFGVTSLVSAASISSIPLIVIVLVLFVVLFGTLLAFGLYFRGVKHLTGTETEVTANTEPIFAALAGYLILGVSLTWVQYIGGALIIISIIVLRTTAKDKKPLVQIEY